MQNWEYHWVRTFNLERDQWDDKKWRAANVHESVKDWGWWVSYSPVHERYVPLVAELNRLGGNGWEVTSTFPSSTALSHSHPDSILLLKRPV